MRKVTEYAVYKGDTFLCWGTAIHCAKLLNQPIETFKYYTYPAYQRKLDKRKNLDDSFIVIKIEEDDELKDEFFKQYMEEIAPFKELTLEDCEYSWNMNKDEIASSDDVDEIIEHLKRDLN